MTLRLAREAPGLSFVVVSLELDERRLEWTYYWGFAELEFEFKGDEASYIYGQLYQRDREIGAGSVPEFDSFEQ